MRGRQQDAARHNGELREEPLVNGRGGARAVLKTDFHAHLVAVQADQHRGGQSDIRSEGTTLRRPVPGNR